MAWRRGRRSHLEAPRLGGRSWRRERAETLAAAGPGRAGGTTAGWAGPGSASPRCFSGPCLARLLAALLSGDSATGCCRALPELLAGVQRS